ncbi:glutathione S-transferase family protein [Marinobacter sp. LN3S78]|uniref:glutathione S-transferase family protein n=1 Tax=Marinobacter sp. LN3S78 TaxID=3382300 RepID=UPI00387AD9D6
MKTLYIANRNYSSWSLRPWLMMRELGLDFHEHLIPFGQQEAWQEYRGLGGNGKVPMLVDGSRMAWDSLAILETLAEDHAGVWPEDSDARAWARSACAEMHSGFAALRDICTMNVGVTVHLNRMPEPLERDIERVIALWQQGLASFGGPFLAGDRFTGVDAFFAPVVFRFRGYQLKAPENCQQYLQRMLSLPGMEEWERLALEEPWRDAAHENDLTRYGHIVEDRRKPANR